MIRRMRFGLNLCAAWLAAMLCAAPLRAGPTLLFEAGTGRVLYAEEMDDHWHPASLTKIMTAYLVFQAIKAGKLAPDSQIPYSEAAHAQPPSKIGLPVGATITVDVALQSLIVKSANDLAVALAEAVGGSEAQFVEQMNATAKRLGMTRTVFRNPHGLPHADQVSTARDLARLSIAVVRDFPEYAPYWALTEMKVGNVKIVSHNSLFKTMEGTDGLKTGFICDSGYNIVASATRDGVRLMAVVLGEANPLERNTRAQQLIEHGYVTLGWKALFGRDTLTSVALASDAKDAASIRNSLIAIECNNRRVARVAAARKRMKARQKAEASKQSPPSAAQKSAGGGPVPAQKAATAAAKAPAGSAPSAPPPAPTRKPAPPAQ